MTAHGHGHGQEIMANSSIEQALGTPATDPAILGGDRLPCDGDDSHAEQARNGQIDDQGQLG